jgi:drug/metabolite transporter (DMT)-like permease
MLLGGVPLLLLSVMAHEPAVSGHFGDLNADDFLALLYTSVFGCAISYGVFFYNASRGTWYDASVGRYSKWAWGGN